MDTRLKLEVVGDTVHITNTTDKQLAMGIAIGVPWSNTMDGLGMPVTIEPGETKALTFLLPPPRTSA